MQYHINRSALAAVLERWEGDLPRQARCDVAERLGQALGAMDAVRLDAALRRIEAHGQAAPRPAAPLDRPLLQQRFEQGVQALQALVAQHNAPAAPRRSAGRSAVPVLPDPPTFAVQQKRYLHTQRQLALNVAQLREQVRTVLARASQGLCQLAALDATMEQLLQAREQRQWAGVLGFVQRRWQHQQAAHAALPEVGMRAFERDMNELLGAELELRLLPVRALVDAAQMDQ
ncbi:MAG: DUF3348 family protein [Rhodoferax sp.]